MKLENKNPNYCATVVRIQNLVELEGLDNLVGMPIMGYQALMSKDHAVGELGILFTAETKLSEDFCYNNNLYRKSEFNKDKEAKGYLESNCRIRSIRLRNHISSALFMPLSSLAFLGVDANDFKEGDSFTTINGVEVCCKYVIQSQNSGRENRVKGKTKKFSRIDALLFPEHQSTDNYWKNIHNIKDDDWVVVTDKLHGTSARFANTLVKRKLTWKEKIAKFFGVKVQETEYDTIAGSRKVIKDIKGSDNFNHFYDVDVWNHHLKFIQHLIPKNWIIYGEIVGWVNEGKAIQKNYTYQIPSGKSIFYVYRISVINENGLTVDLSWDQIKEFCKNNGLNHVPEIWQGYHKDFDESVYMNKRFVEDLGMTQCLPLDKESPTDEGIVVRINAIKPYLLKAKSPNFLLHETKQLDTGEVDIESQESETEN
jgi:hypothetical protein